MATGGSYILINNNSEEDELLLGSNSLLNRLQMIQVQNIANINLQIYNNESKINKLQDLLIGEKDLGNISKINDSINTIIDMNKLLKTTDNRPNMQNIRETHRMLIDAEYKIYI